MAKVLEQKASPKYKYTCSGCNAVVGFGEGDVFRHRHSYDYLGDSEVDDAVKCPACGKVKVLHYRWRPKPGDVTFAE